MKKITVTYWIFTALMIALMGIGSIPDIMSSPEAVALFDHLGYPAYLLPFIGVAKLLGVAAILTPGFPRLKEWAYAGFVFDLTGAMYSSLAVGDPPSGLVFFFIGYIVIGGSYVYHHKRCKAAAFASISK